MAKEPMDDSATILHDRQEKEDVKEPDGRPEDSEVPSSLTVTSRVLYMLGDIAAGPAFRFTQWLELVRKRGGGYRFSKYSCRLPTQMSDTSMPSSAGESSMDSKCSLFSEQSTESSLWERFGRVVMLDIESNSFSWGMLSSLHRTEHSSSADHSEDEQNKPVEVTVNSGGVVFFALFKQPDQGDTIQKEAAAVIKISSSRMVTQSERLGYEFAKFLGVQTPKARVIHNTSPEWLQIKEASEKAKDSAIVEGDEVGEVTCSELLEALEFSRCLLLMNYVHGSPLLESSGAFSSPEAAEKIGAALGGILMLDLVIRNEDRLPCRQLGWRGNPANLLLAEKMVLARTDALEEALDSAMKRYRPQVIRALQKERRASSVESRLNVHDSTLESHNSGLSDDTMSPRVNNKSFWDQPSDESSSDLQLVVIDSSIPRRPPAGKRSNDDENYPKLVELLLNSSEYSASLVHEITGGKLGPPSLDVAEIASAVHEFRRGFRSAFRDLQGFHIFLVTLQQKLDGLLRVFLNIMNRASSEAFDKEDVNMIASDSPLQTSGSVQCASPRSKETTTATRHLHSGHKESSDSSSAVSREGWHGKFNKGSGDALHCMRLTSKLRAFHKSAKDDAESNKELEQWNEMLRTDVVKLCQKHNFNSGFFECNDNSVVDAYELKVRLDHILERIALISDAANTEKPSKITSSLFIGGALAARSVHTLQHLGISHMLCLCSNEIGQSDSQYPDLFEYKNFSICDNEDTNISDIFEEASDFIDHVEQTNGRVLVHCFVGRSRSATLVLAYLMLRKKFTLLEAWNTLKRVHCRAQPNDGFARILQGLDRKLHGSVSMEWQQRKPAMKVCPICGKDVGLSSSSLKLHLQRSHKTLSSGSVDSGMTMEIHKALTALNIAQAEAVSCHHLKIPSKTT